MKDGEALAYSSQDMRVMQIDLKKIRKDAEIMAKWIDDQTAPCNCTDCEQIMTVARKYIKLSPDAIVNALIV